MDHTLGDGQQRCSFIAVIGAPNAGKSTLVNGMVGAKVSIVTHKVQTTRARVRGVVMADVEGDAVGTDHPSKAQLVFIDTPGIFRPRRRLDRAMVSAAWDGLEGADETLVIVDAAVYDGPASTPATKRARADTDRVLDELKERNAKERNATPILVLNKVDLVERSRLLKLAAEMNDRLGFEETFFIAAANDDGVQELKMFLAARAPIGPWMYPEDQLSDMSDRLLAAEVTREKLFLRLHDELPYESTVETTDWKRTKKGELRLEQTIFVSRESHKPIVLGKAGQTIKTVGASSREELEKLLGEKVHLFLFVKVRENWSDENARLRELGLEPVA
ncbi:MAG: GTPase Era [Pseudomonadota bacterium]